MPYPVDFGPKFTPTHGPSRSLDDRDSNMLRNEEIEALLDDLHRPTTKAKVGSTVGSLIATSFEWLILMTQSKRSKVFLKSIHCSVYNFRSFLLVIQKDKIIRIDTKMNSNLN